MKAFPVNTHEPYNDGMNLRDYFAAKAMQALINDALGQDNDNLWEQEVKQLAETSYYVANAMMEARE